MAEQKLFITIKLTHTYPLHNDHGEVIVLIDPVEI